MRLVPRVIKMSEPSVKSNSDEPGMFFTDRNLQEKVDLQVRK